MSISKKTTKIILFSVIGAIVAALATLVVLLVQKDAKLSDFEMQSFVQTSSKVTNYLQAIDNDIESAEPEQLDKYIAFAVLYAYNENDASAVSAEDIQSIVDSHFVYASDRDLIEKTSITPTLDHFTITKPYGTNEFTITTQRNPEEVSRTPIVRYLLKDVSKSDNLYTAHYAKYVASDPYKIFNYANDNHIEIKGAGDYLKGNGKVAPLRDVITLENANELAEFEKELTVIFEASDAGLRLKEIK